MKTILLTFVQLLILNICIAQVFTNDNFLHYSGIGDIGIGMACSPTFADIDGDGDSDIYVGENYGKIYVFSNDGNGNFTAENYLQADGSDINPGSASSPVFADIDGDSDLDLYIGEGNGRVSVFTNDGNGNFSYSGYLQADGSNIYVGYYNAPAFSDIDSDGDLDLYIGSHHGNIRVFINDGIGNFSSNGYLQADGSNIEIGDMSSPAFADIDIDGDIDLYVGEFQGKIRVFINDGNGNFSDNGYLTAQGNIVDVGSKPNPNFIDLDNDNDLDLYVGNYYGKIKVLINDGSGNFILPENLQAFGSDLDVSWYATPAFADVNGNGILDLYMGESSGYIKVFTNDGNGNFTLSGNLEANNSVINIGTYSDPVFADLDLDGDNDLYVGEFNGRINVYLNDGNGNFSGDGYLQADGFDIDVTEYSTPAFADIDGDNDLDLYIGENDGFILVFTNNGNGNFTSSGYLQADGSDINIGYFSNPTFADIDLDGDLDLYVGENSGYIKVFINTGNGEFTADGNLQADGTDICVDYISTPVFADINDNCGIELYVGKYDGRTNSYLQIDVIPPEITSLIDDQIIGTNENCEGILPDYRDDLRAIDNCDTILIVSQIPVPGTIVAGAVNLVTLTVSDESGNQSEISFNVELVDDTNPVITSTHNDIIVIDEGNCEAILQSYVSSVTAFDNCDSDLDIIQTPAEGTTITGTINQVTISVTDDTGNYSEVSFNVAVEDNTDPIISSTHDDQLIDANTDCEANLPDYTGDVTATDNCDINLDITQDPAPGTIISGMMNSVTLTVTDDAGNSDELSFNLEVVDNTDPSITCIGNQTIIADDENNTYTVQGTEFDPTSAEDNCVLVNILNDFNSTSTLDGEVLPLGTTTIEWTAEDQAGNTSSCSFEVLVEAYEDIAELQKVGIFIYPNPSDGLFFLKTKDSYEITVSDITGKNLIEFESEKGKSEIDLSKYAKGIYLIKFRNSDILRITKIIKN